METPQNNSKCAVPMLVCSMQARCFIVCVHHPKKKTVKRKRIPELHRVVVKRNFVCAEEKDTQK